MVEQTNPYQESTAALAEQIATYTLVIDRSIKRLPFSHIPMSFIADDWVLDFDVSEAGQIYSAIETAKRARFLALIELLDKNNMREEIHALLYVGGLHRYLKGDWE